MPDREPAFQHYRMILRGLVNKAVIGTLIIRDLFADFGARSRMDAPHEDIFGSAAGTSARPCRAVDRPPERHGFPQARLRSRKPDQPGSDKCTGVSLQSFACGPSRQEARSRPLPRLRSCLREGLHNRLILCPSRSPSAAKGELASAIAQRDRARTFRRATYRPGGVRSPIFPRGIGCRSKPVLPAPRQHAPHLRRVSGLRLPVVRAARHAVDPGQSGAKRRR